MFQNLVGNEKVKEILSKTLKSNSVLHSYLFVGTEGIGKRLFAKEFAKAILCENKENKPCNACKSCVEFKNDNNPDFMIIEPDGNSIKIEQVRFLIQKISEKPISSEHKVYIINDSDKMTVEAQNSLLKTLEEPPEYACLILITSNESKLLNTIKSRCTKIFFNKIEDSKIEEYVRNNVTNDVTKSMIKASQGSIGKALKLQNFKEAYSNIEELVEQLDKKDLLYIMNKSEILTKEKENIYEILEYINVILYNTKEIRKLNCIKIVEETKKRLLSNSNFDMTIDNLLIKMWEEVNEKYSRG